MLKSLISLQNFKEKMEVKRQEMIIEAIADFDDDYNDDGILEGEEPTIERIEGYDCVRLLCTGEFFPVSLRICL